MKNKFEPDDPRRLIEARRKKVVKAYKRWIQLHGRAERGSQSNSDKLFYAAVVESLDLTRDAVPKRIGIPTTRSGWSNWQAGRGGLIVKLRLDVCMAILALTEIDVSDNGFLATASVNATELVKLGRVEVDRKGQQATATITIDKLEVRASGSKDVFLCDTKKNPTPSDYRRRIGSVRFGLKEASLYIQSPDTLVPIIRRLGDGDCTEHGSSNAGELTLDSEESNRWRIEPPFNKQVIQAHFEDLRLCFLDDRHGISLVVGVSVARNNVEPKIALDDGVKIAGAQHETAREKLVEQVLRHRVADGGTWKRFTLSRAEISS